MLTFIIIRDRCVLYIKTIKKAIFISLLINIFWNNFASNQVFQSTKVISDIG